MKKCRIYDTDNDQDMLELNEKYSKEHLKKIKAELDSLVRHEEEKKEHEFQSGETCPICGSIEYYQSGTCKTCRTCAYAGSCG